MAVITLADAKDHLNIATSADDAELGSFITRAEAAVTRRVGPLVTESVSQRVDGGPVLVLRYRTASALTSITPVGGTALPLTGLHLEAGIVEFDSGACFPARRYDVVYAAGWGASAAGVPDDLKLAILELLRHMWASQRGKRPMTVGALPDTDGEVLTGLSGGAGAITQTGGAEGLSADRKIT